MRGLRRENSHVLIGDVFHSLVEDEVKIALGLLIPQIRNQMLWGENGNIGSKGI